jgi:hypothetical protein
MKKFVGGIIVAAAMMALSMGGASAAPFGGSQTQGAPGVESMVVHVSDYCRELRMACEHKDELGERGQGNCRRYREECGGRSHCERLRHACLHKHETGREGEGLCRRYRQECRGSW